MGSQKQLRLEKERRACHLTAPLSCWTQLLPSQPSAPLPFLSSCPASLFNPFHAQVSSPLPMCMAQVWPAHTRLHASSLQCHYLHPIKENVFFPFIFSSFHSCLSCKVLQRRFTPALLCAKHFPLSRPSSSPHLSAHWCHPTSDGMQTSANCACDCIYVFLWPHFSPRKQKCDHTL